MLNNFDDEVLMSGNDYDLSSSESSSSDDDWFNHVNGLSVLFLCR
jgi:hypothetical protein